MLMKIVFHGRARYRVGERASERLLCGAFSIPRSDPHRPGCERRHELPVFDGRIALGDGLRDVHSSSRLIVPEYSGEPQARCTASCADLLIFFCWCRKKPPPIPITYQQLFRHTTRTQSSRSDRWNVLLLAHIEPDAPASRKEERGDVRQDSFPVGWRSDRGMLRPVARRCAGAGPNRPMGRITAARLGPWARSIRGRSPRSPGTPWLLRISEVGADTPFNPSIRLLAPDGSQLGLQSGALAAQITARATLTGTYQVLVTSAFANTGSYVLTLVKIPGAFIVPPGDEGGPMTAGLNHPGSLPAATWTPGPLPPTRTTASS